MRRALATIAAALLLAGCTAVGAQPLNTPTITQLVERIDKQDATIATLRTDLKTASVRAKTAKAHAARAEALHERAAARIAALEAETGKLAHLGAFLMHDPNPIYIETQTPRFSDAAVFRWQVSVPSASGVTITLPDIDGYRWDASTLTLAPARTGDLTAILRPIDGAGTEGKPVQFRAHIAGWGIAFDGHVLRSFHRAD